MVSQCGMDTTEFWGHCGNCDTTITAYRNERSWHIRCSKCGWRPCPNWKQLIAQENAEAEAYRRAHGYYEEIPFWLPQKSHRCWDIAKGELKRL